MSLSFHELPFNRTNIDLAASLNIHFLIDNVPCMRYFIG